MEVANTVFMINPSNGLLVDYHRDIVKPLIGRILLSEEIQKKFYPEISFNTGATDDELIDIVTKMQSSM